ncbi:MAG TPA: OmpA family protein, partial [Puia sp.]|nr:OmpA family protein [Puia sp.]
PAAYGVLGRHVIASGMNVKDLSSFLNSEKKKTLNSIPAGIFVEGIMGFENLSGFSNNFAGAQTKPAREKIKLNWVIPVALIALTAGALWFFLGRQQSPELTSIPPVRQSVAVNDTVATTPDRQPVAVTGTVAAAPVSDSRYSVTLPGGKPLYVKKGSMEDQLAAFFNDPNSKPSRRFIFNFDQVKYNTGTAVITKESMPQIKNVAAILTAFPNARIKIAGFNEKGGDSVLNSELSENRAEAIANALKAAGVNKGQIAGAEGFGSDFAQYAEDAADSLRMRDRRVAISVRAK